MTDASKCCGADTVGVELPWIYDGILYWVCSGCQRAWARNWQDWGQMQVCADMWAAKHNLTRASTS